MTSFRPYEPDQHLLLPPSLRDWLPPDHLAWFISETVDQLLAGRSPEDDALASPATLCRFENQRSDARLVDVMHVMIDVFIESFGRRKPTEPLILDIDATADPAHGEQERNFFNGFYDCHCFLPLFVFCGEHLLFSWLRPSSRHASHNSRAVLALIVRRLREKWPDVEIIVRADAGFAMPRILDWCDENGVDDIIGHVKNPKLDRRISRHLDRARIKFEKSGEPERIYTSFVDRARSWVVLGSHELPRVPGESDAIGSERSRIVLLAHVRRVGLRGTTMARAQAWIIRARLFKVATRVVVSVRRVRLKLSESWPHADVLTRALQNLLRRTHDPPDWRLA